MIRCDMETEAKQFVVGKGTKPQGITPAIALCDPKYARNVSMIMRLASCYGIKQLWYSGDRVSLDDPGKNLDFDPRANGKRPKARLPREERMKGYKEVELRQYDKFFDMFKGATPIAVELRPQAIPLHHFEHPKNALYVFGPEDGGIDQVTARHCHQFVVVPTRHCLNLATTVATILWDRKLKALMDGSEEDLPMSEVLNEPRGGIK